MTHFLTQAGGTELEWPGPEGMGYGTWEVPSPSAKAVTKAAQGEPCSESPECNPVDSEA